MDAEIDGTKTVPGDVPAFGDLLRQYRRRAGLTQEALAERAGVSVRTITEVERGINRSPRRDTLHLLADALQLSTQERAHLEAVRVAGSVRSHSRPRADPAPALPGHTQRRRRPRVLVLTSVGALVLILLISIGTLVVYRSIPSTAHRLAVGSKPVLRAVWGGAVSNASFQPTMIAVGPDGMIYVADDARDTIVRLSPAGQLLQSWRVPPAPLVRTDPLGNGIHHAFLTVDRRGDVYVVDQSHNRILMFSPTGERLAAWGRLG
ncbi:MAG TPA: helix-turn-helix domain-containing protein, partial [Chloroflexota bacterium]